MTTQFWSGFAVAVAALVGVSAYAYWGSTVVEEPRGGNISQERVTEFTEALRTTFITEQGHPIEGFEPWMFMEVYPGLVAQDFKNVDALIGLYRVEDGAVTYDLNGEVELHSAARAISDEGMRQLLWNVGQRLDIDSEAEGSLALLLATLKSGEPAVPETPAPQMGRVSIEGTIVCLPKKGPGPHTLECAYGLQATSGEHYGLRNLFEGDWPWPLDTGERARIEGWVEAPEANTSYDIVGIIDVDTFEKL
jgi:hypothetical protein